ncbi:hypothetical protein niasHT_034296 [Heterodera trifolii]|uniref:Uncharacterized protein n=1 Tax=Heterodera trifolii TaxID=157864 RepID=A0ABD2HR83_9BILA
MDNEQMKNMEKYGQIGKTLKVKKEKCENGQTEKVNYSTEKQLKKEQQNEEQKEINGRIKVSWLYSERHERSWVRVPTRNDIDISPPVKISKSVLFLNAIPVVGMIGNSGNSRACHGTSRTSICRWKKMAKLTKAQKRHTEASKRKIMKEYARLKAMELSDTKIAQELGVDRKTICYWKAKLAKQLTKTKVPQSAAASSSSSFAGRDDLWVWNWSTKKRT